MALGKGAPIALVLGSAGLASAQYALLPSPFSGNFFEGFETFPLGNTGTPHFPSGGNPYADFAIGGGLATFASYGYPSEGGSYPYVYNSQSTWANWFPVVEGQQALLLRYFVSFNRLDFLHPITRFGLHVRAGDPGALHRDPTIGFRFFGMNGTLLGQYSTVYPFASFNELGIVLTDPKWFGFEFDQPISRIEFWADHLSHPNGTPMSIDGITASYRVIPGPVAGLAFALGLFGRGRRCRNSAEVRKRLARPTCVARARGYPQSPLPQAAARPAASGLRGAK
jgi:hypothetical protein